MSVETVRIFTCDKCKATSSHSMAADDQPSGWARLTLSAPPLAPPTEASQSWSGYLCSTCREVLFLSPGPLHGVVR